MDMTYNEETDKWQMVGGTYDVTIACGDSETRDLLEEFIESGALTDAFLEWQGEDHQTADEMLAALGFQKNTSVCYSEELEKLLYEKPVMGDSDCEAIVFEDGEVTFYNLMCRALWMQPALVDAISAKCREMGWK